ncbi:hypothetical protein BD779DRAFT_1514842 [Infundibulicybe gibba]|nr:hypothetical protein BD779DRAFT_1514842 [Infundibulicybe gibba]
MLSLITYTIAGALASSFAYGILCILFVISMFLFVRWAPTSQNTPRYSVWMEPAVLASILLFVVVTAHWVNTIYRLFEALGAGSMEDSMLFILDQSKTSNIVELALTFLAGILTCLQIYRVWTISSHNRAVVAFPVISAIGMTVAFFAVVYQLIRAGVVANMASHRELLSSLNHWVIPACVFTISTNVYCSGFITWKLWSHQRIGTGASGDGIIPYLSISPYRSWVIFFFITYEAQLDINSFVGVLWPPMAGIAIMLINARVGLNRIQKFNLIQNPPISTLNNRYSGTSTRGHGIETVITQTTSVVGDDPTTSQPHYPYHFDFPKNPC